MTRDHPEAASWEEVLREVRFVALSARDHNSAVAPRG